MRVWRKKKPTVFFGFCFEKEKNPKTNIQFTSLYFGWKEKRCGELYVFSIHHAVYNIARQLKLLVNW